MVPGRLRRLRRAALAVGGLVAVAVGGAALASPPTSATSSDRDGRTWLAVPDGEGSRLLLVNGISGLIEADADLDAPASEVRFVSERAGRTLLATGDSFAVVDDARHEIARVDDAAAVALADDGIVKLAGTAATLLPLAEAGDDAPPTERRLASLPSPIADGTALVTDADGAVWYLSRGGATVPNAFRLSNDGTTTPFAVDSSAERLLIVDGEVHVRDDTGVRAV
jgi:hypothetical protein